MSLHPFQTPCCHRGGEVNDAVTRRAYEVYCHIYAPQEEMITGGCRGGFSYGELLAFLYAYPFPRAEWAARVTEAFRGMRAGRT